MENKPSQKFIIGAGLISVLVAILFYVSSFVPGTTDSNAVLEQETPVNGSEVSDSDMLDTGDNLSSFKGKLIAGSYDKVPYLEFNNEDFQKALADGKYVFLEFYATWCPTCRTQEKDFVSAFNSLNRSDIVGFRVNYNDTETDSVEKSLATRFGVTYQHHKVILSGSDELLNANEIWNKAKLVKTLSEL